jgi:hypothetical protein
MRSDAKGKLIAWIEPNGRGEFLGCFCGEGRDGDFSRASRGMDRCVGAAARLQQVTPFAAAGLTLPRRRIACSLSRRAPLRARM